jgi:hypothetical protein
LHGRTSVDIVVDRSHSESALTEHRHDGEQRPAASPRDGESGHASPYPLSRLAPRFDLVSMAEEIQAADSMLAAVAGAELESIAEQIRALRMRAGEVLERARRDAGLHRARCRFRKQPGRIYHLYREPSGQLYFSLLSPDDWGGRPPHAFEGSYRLELDLSWTPASEIAERDRSRAASRRLLEG